MWEKTLQEIIDYVEDHLQRTNDSINQDEIARMAGCSYSFFQKVFSYMMGISFAEYVRSRKMTLAGYDLKSTNMRVIDLSYKYGYDSPTSFTKAFVQFHGVSPKQAKKNNQTLRVVNKMQVHHHSKSTWKIVQQPALRLVGKRKIISCREGKHQQQIPQFWNESLKSGLFASLSAMDRGHSRGVFGVFEAIDEEKQEITYMMAVQCDEKIKEGYDEIMIPEQTWAIFDCIGVPPMSIQRGWQYLNQEWLKQYPFKHAHCPELEWYSEGNSFDEEYLSQIWIPIELES